MTIVPPPVEDTAMRAWEFPENEPEPPAQWSKYVPGEPQLRAAAFGTLIGLLAAVLLGAAYAAEPGGSLWALNRTVFTTHSQDVAVRAVVSPLKNAQDILGNGQQPSPDQLTEARTSLNEAKRGLEFVSASNERTTLQNLYLQLTQQLRQYTPEQAQQLPALPAPPEVNTDANLAANVGPAAPASSPPSWGYAAAASAPGPAPQSYSAPPPPGIPVDPVADWPAPVAPPLTPNLLDLGGYDQSWSLLYGYNVLDWFNWGLSGFNRYGFDFMGFDRWGYDRWGYDRWGYDRSGYNWDGYNWSGYNRDGRDRDGRNEWGQFRDDDPRDQGWYDRYHPYREYYDWKFQNTNPVYSRNLWDQAHGVNPAQYRDWNLNRSWDNPLERDWSPVTSTARVADRPVLAEPVVNLDASLAQFLTDDKSARPSGDLIKDLSTKSVRNFSKELATPPPAPEKTPTSVSPVEVKPAAPPVLTAPVPTVPPKQVPEDFTPPSLPAVPPLTPAPSTEPRATSSTSSPAPSTEPSQSPTPTSGPPTNATTSIPAPAPTSAAPASTPKEETSAPVTTPTAPTHETPATPTPTPRQTVTTPPSETAEPSAAPEPTKQHSTPTYEAPTSEAPTPRATVEPAPQQVPTEAPAKQAPVERETPPSRASAPETVAPTREAPTREAPTYSTATQAPSSGGGGGYGSGSSGSSGSSGGGHH